MPYKWKPNKTQRREFSERMATDTDFQQAYNQRKEQRAEKKRATSKFDYQTAGGEYIPTGSQNNVAFECIHPTASMFFLWVIGYNFGSKRI